MALPIGFAELNEATERGRKINELVDKIMYWKPIKTKDDLPTSVRRVLFLKKGWVEEAKTQMRLMYLDEIHFTPNPRTADVFVRDYAAWVELPPPYEDK